jgi:predicted GIY-YIG superfamily endonuclease
MFYVYLIQSTKFLKEHYVGYSQDLKTRIKDHNYGKSVHTSKFKPWKLLAYFAFNQMQTAKDFESYLKTGSGRAFLKKHFLQNNP